VKLKDIHPESLSEIQGVFSADPSEDKVETSADGFFHAAMKMVPEAGSAAQPDGRYPLIRKLNRNGKLVWEFAFHSTFLDLNSCSPFSILSFTRTRIL